MYFLNSLLLFCLIVLADVLRRRPCLGFLAVSVDRMPFQDLGYAEAITSFVERVHQVRSAST